MKLISFFLIVVICLCFFSTLKATKTHQDSQELNLNSPEVSANSESMRGNNPGSPQGGPSMPEEEPKILQMEEERLQNSFLRQREASINHEIDASLPNGALNS